VVWQWQFTVADSCGTSHAMQQDLRLTDGILFPPCCIPGYAKDITKPHGECYAFRDGSTVDLCCGTGTRTCAPTPAPTPAQFTWDMSWSTCGAHSGIIVGMSVSVTSKVTVGIFPGNGYSATLVCDFDLQQRSLGATFTTTYGSGEVFTSPRVTSGCASISGTKTGERSECCFPSDGTAAALPLLLLPVVPKNPAAMAIAQE
jgi:hypothetical protein